MQDPISNQVEKSLSLIKLVSDGGIGAQIIIIILSVLFVISVYIYIERSFVLKSAQKIDETFMEQIKHYVKQGKINDAKQLCMNENSPISNLLSKGISRIGKPLEDISSSIENAGKLGFKNGSALYPMVTMNGEECHNEWEITFEEIHRNGAIAYAIFNYERFTGDLTYIPEMGLEVLIAISRFWTERVNYSENKKAYVILGVTGPNEYEHEHEHE